MFAIPKSVLISGGVIVAALTVGVVVQHVNTSKQGAGPLAGTTNSMMDLLHPAAYHGRQQLLLATDSVREIHRANGSLQGTYDGTALLKAADSWSYGTPGIMNPRRDIQGDGIATFNEVRQVVRSFDADGSGVIDSHEARQLEHAIGVQYTPGVLDTLI
jgi:hypothetical protein